MGYECFYCGLEGIMFKVSGLKFEVNVIALTST